MSCTSAGPMAQPVVVARVIRVGAAARGKSRRKHVVDGKTEVRLGRVSRGRGQRPLRRRHDNVGPSPAARRRRRRPRGRVRRAAHHHAQRGAPHQTQSRGCATPLVSYRWHLSGWVGRWSRWVELDDRLKRSKRVVRVRTCAVCKSGSWIESMADIEPCVWSQATEVTRTLRYGEWLDKSAPSLTADAPPT